MAFDAAGQVIVSRRFPFDLDADIDTDAEDNASSKGRPDVVSGVAPFDNCVFFCVNGTAEKDSLPSLGPLYLSVPSKMLLPCQP